MLALKYCRPIGTGAMGTWHECLWNLNWFDQNHAHTVASKIDRPRSGSQFRVLGWTSSLSACWSFPAVLSQVQHRHTTKMHWHFMWHFYSVTKSIHRIKFELNASKSPVLLDIITCGSMHEYGTALIHAHNQDKICLLLQFKGEEPTLVLQYSSDDQNKTQWNRSLVSQFNISRSLRVLGMRREAPQGHGDWHIPVSFQDNNKGACIRINL